MSPSTITLHSRTYTIPTQPTVIICVDGFDPTYLAHALSTNLAPNLANFVKSGFHTTANSCMPSFTNPNNVSIITGAPPSTHGIAGNFFLDAATGEEKMVLDDTLLRGDTLLQLLAEQGVPLAAVTAKDKLRRILAHGLTSATAAGTALCFSAQDAAACTRAEHGVADVEAWIGRAAPSQYSADLSLFVLDAGVRILEEGRARVLYLTLSDYVQHKYAAGEAEADAFFAALDRRVGRFVELGAVVAVTGDHGMSEKCGFEGGAPDILFLEDVLREAFGEGVARVVCPITDPFVRHHGALGSFVRVHVTDKRLVPDMIRLCETLDQVEVALDGNSAAQRWELPVDREGDIVAVSKKHAVIGSRKEEHDLSNINDHKLRSHGGLSEQEVPLLLSRPVRDAAAAAKRQWRNYDIFDLALNW